MKRIYFIFLFSFLAVVILGFERKEDYMQERFKMVEEQIASRGIKDERVLAAMQKVERHLFVPKSLQEHAYEDRPLLIGHEQTISQPYIVAYMTESLGLKSTDKVLEIGTGSGYQAAILAELVKEVYTIEIVLPLAQRAKNLLTQLGYKNIFVKHGDGFEGWEEFAPFDAIIVTAAPEALPQRLLEQLKVGGKIVIPIGTVTQELYLFIKQRDTVTKERLLPVRFVPMISGNE